MGHVIGRIRAWHIAAIFALLGITFTYFFQVRADFFRDSVFSFVPLLERKVLDTKFKARGRVDIEPRVVIAAGDEATLAHPSFGVWGAWDRSVFATVIENLLEAGADVVGFDMVLSEQVGIAPSVAEKLEGLTQELNLVGQMRALKNNERRLEDVKVDIARLVDAMTKARSGTARLAEVFEAHSSRVTQGFILNPQPDANAIVQAGSLKAFRAVQNERFEAIADFGYETYGRALVEEQFENAGEGLDERVVRLAEERPVTDLLRVEEAEGDLVTPLDSYIEAAEFLGYFNASPDDDGVMRALPLVFRYKDKLLPSLSLTLASQAIGANPLFVGSRFTDEGLERVVLPAEEGAMVEIPVDDRGRVLINYFGPSKALNLDDPEDERGVFPHISLAAIYDGTFDKEVVKGRIVIVAVTAIGTYDQRVTPFTSVAPGVEMHAAAVQSMVTGQVLRRLPGYVQIEMLLAVLLALLLALVLPRVGVVGGVALTLLLSAGWVVFDFSILFHQNQWFHQLPLQIQLWLSWAGIVVLGYLTEGREKAQLKKEFSTVLAPGVVDQLLKNPELAGLGGDERDMTVMFSDIRGFTTMSEMMTPEELTQFLNEYLTPMTDILIERQGTLDKYMGDAIMAFWGAPVRQTDHAARACLAALDMMEELGRLQQRWKREGKPEIDIGIGLNSGLMRVGFMGSERMRNYTLLGDNVNLGARLEGINKQYGTNIIISEFTYRAAQGQVYGRVIDAVRVKGKAEPVTIYELRGAGKANGTDEKLMADFDAAMALYRAQDFSGAKAGFGALVEAHDDPPSQIYVERCAIFEKSPPGEDWDGVFVMTTK